MTTYQFPGKEDVRITVGDEKQTDFFPRMKIKRWDNEVNFSVGIVSKFRGSHNVVNDKVEWNDGHGIRSRFYEKAFDEFEFEIILDERPAPGFILLSIKTKGLLFTYQPELTEEEINKKCMRPDNVVGSYAVYHESMKGNYLGGKNYRAGKFCHIYRPFATDVNGKIEWCDMDITGNVMKITIPDGLVYPVVVDPTFGCNPASPGGSWYEVWASDDMTGSVFISPTDIDTAQNIKAYVRKYCGYDYYPDFHIKGCIISSSNLNIIANGTGSASSLITSLTGVWAESDFATDPSPAGCTAYILMEIADQQHDLAYDTGGFCQGAEDASNSYASPQNLVSATGDNSKFSIYCTYTAEAAGDGGATQLVNGGLVS